MVLTCIIVRGTFAGQQYVSMYHCCIFHNVSKSEAIDLLESFVLEDRGYL